MSWEEGRVVSEPLGRSVVATTVGCRGKSEVPGTADSVDCAYMMMCIECHDNMGR